MTKFWKLLSMVLALTTLLCGCAPAEVPSEEPSSNQNPQLSEGLFLGGQMPELVVTTVQGQTVALSELLQQKKVVVLNFWFADCIWCIREFPVMEVSYQKYKQDAEILALNPFDAQKHITSFQEEHSLSFPMASCGRDLAIAFGVTGYPTSVVIDRDGRICMIHSGAITESQVFDKLFETFTAEEYTPRVYHSINELL